MNSFLNALFQFLNPIVIFFASLAGIAAFLLGALADPQGFMNQVVCGIIDGVAVIFPSTPDNLKIGTMIDSLGASMPAVGRGIIREVFNTILIIAGLLAVIKIYKLLPFKAS